MDVMQYPWIGANKKSAPTAGPMTAGMNAARSAIERLRTRTPYPEAPGKWRGRGTTAV